MAILVWREQIFVARARKECSLLRRTWVLGEDAGAKELAVMDRPFSESIMLEALAYGEMRLRR